MRLVNTKNCALLQQFAGAFSRFLPTLPYPFIGGDNSPPISAHSPPVGVAMTNLPVTPTVLRPQPQLPPSAATMAAAKAAATAGHMNNGTTPSTLSPLRIRVSSPNRINAVNPSWPTQNDKSLGKLIIGANSSNGSSNSNSTSDLNAMVHQQQQQVSSSQCLNTPFTPSDHPSPNSATISVPRPQPLTVIMILSPKQQQQRTNGIIRIVGAGNTTTTSTSGIGIGPPHTLHRPFSPSPQPNDVS